MKFVWLAFAVSTLWLALLSVLLRRRDPDGVRAPDDLEPEALKPLRHTATICNTSYIDRSVMLGDTDFKYCQFIRCRLINDGPFSFADCFMDSCSLQSANVVKAQAIDEPRAERQHRKPRNKRVPLTTPAQED